MSNQTNKSNYPMNIPNVKPIFVTMAIGSKGQELYQISKPSFDRYCQRFEIPLHLIDTNKIGSASGYHDKLQIRELLLDGYHVLYVDADIIIHPEAPNIFELTPAHRIALYDQKWFIHSFNDNRVRQVIKLEGSTVDIRGDFYNAGVMFVPPSFEYLFKTPTEFVTDDECLLNARLAIHDINPFRLNQKWNRMVGCSGMGDAYFYHYAAMGDRLPKMRTLMNSFTEFKES